jgi:hypothetical protein
MKDLAYIGLSLLVFGAYIIGAILYANWESRRNNLNK